MRQSVAPMLARLAEELPRGDGWLFEPKWDGFRTVLSRDDANVVMDSRNGKRLDALFPEVASAALEALPERCTVDGELVCPTPDGGVEFEGLLRRMSRRTGDPAALVLFDLLVLGGDDVRSESFAERRGLLQRAARPHPLIGVTPQTDDPLEAAAWLDCEVRGIEGVVAKRAGSPYRPRQRGWVKVKRRRTVDCVVGGYRAGRLLLGLYDVAGLLHHVGETVPLPAAMRGMVETWIASTIGPSFTGRPPGIGRWEGNRYEEWTECLPVAVCEVSYTLLDAGRFRHAVRFVRWRSDREPRSCLRDQLDGRQGSGSGA